MNRCPPREHLARLLADQLSADEGAALEAHLCDCAGCQSALSELSDGADIPRWRQWARAGLASLSTPFPTPPCEPEPILPRTAPPGYEILGTLGRGGVGVVYKARQVSLGRLVALKMLRVGPLAGPEELARFAQEAEAVARLRHPHIVQVHEVGRHDGMPFLALEYVEGGSLADRLRRAPQPPRPTAELVRLLARAVQHAHEVGILHRDLKPGNVLLASAAWGEGLGVPGYGLPKLSDFGLAKCLEGVGGDGLTETGDVLGTPCYMAPEQAQGQGRNAGRPADVYALGVILYEMLTGRPPFHAATGLETLMQAAHHEPVSPRALEPGVPRDLETICLKCLQKEPAKRYPTAAELAEDLERFLAGRPIHARPTGPLERGLKWMRRSPAAAGLALLGLLVAAVGFPLVTFLWLDAAHANREAVERQGEAEEQRGKADDLRQAAELREARLTAARALDLCDRGEVQAGLELLADALGMAERLPGQEALQRALRVNLAEWPEQLRRPGAVHDNPAGRVWNITFSPDGKTLVLNGPHGLHLWDPGGRRQSRAMLVPGPAMVPSPPGSAAFSPDGRLLAAGYDDHKVRLWDPATGKQRSDPLRIDGAGGSQVAFHPDGKVLATATEKAIQFWDPATGRLLHTEPYPGWVMCLAYSPDGAHLALGDYQGQVWLWPTSPGPASARDGRRLLGHRLTVSAIAFDPRPGAATVATASRDGTVRFWDVATGRPRGRPRVHAQEVGAMAWGPDGRWLLTGSNDLTAQLWDADTLAPVGAPWRFDAPVSAVRFAPSSRACVISTEDGKVQFWDLPAGRVPDRALPHGWPVEQVAFWPAGGALLTAGWRGVRTWSDDGRPLAELRTADRLRHAAWASRAPVLISAHWYQDVERWRLEGGSRPDRLLPALPSGTKRAIDRVALSPDGSNAYGLEESGRHVRRWDVATGRELDPVRYDGVVSRLALSPDGKLLAVVVQTEGGRGVWLRPADSPGEAGFGLFNGEHPRCLAFSADGETLVAGGRSGRVCMWDVEKRELRPWGVGQEHHRGEVLGVGFSPDRRTLLTGGADGRARFWDVATGLPLGPPLPHAGPVLSVAFRDDGGAVLTGCQDGQAYRWRPPLPPATGTPGELRTRPLR